MTNLSTGPTRATAPWLTLALTDGIGPILARRLIEIAGSPAAACAADAKLLRRVEGVGTAKANVIAASLNEAAAKASEEAQRAAAVGARIICPDDAEYSPLLKTIPDPPLVLYVRGTLQPRDLHAVAIVGSRRCSFYGREQAERFGALLGGAGVVVVSGGARGIDSAAHRGALSHPQGRTIAVLGSGVNVAYPPENESLFEQIAQRGAVISEHPIDAAPLAENFPRRNRIVSGLSRGVLVIEADERSGALITARQAGEDHGRTVFALPGRVDNKLSIGPHQLIRDGATLVTGLEEILQELGPLPAEAVDAVEASAAPVTLFDSPVEGSKPPIAERQLAPHPMTENQWLANLSEPQRAIMEALGTEPISVDGLIERSGLEASVVMRELTFLALKGLVKRTDGQMFRRTR